MVCCSNRWKFLSWPPFVWEEGCVSLICHHVSKCVHFSLSHTAASSCPVMKDWKWWWIIFRAICTLLFVTGNMKAISVNLRDIMSILAGPCTDTCLTNTQRCIGKWLSKKFYHDYYVLLIAVFTPTRSLQSSL